MEDVSRRQSDAMVTAMLDRPEMTEQQFLAISRQVKDLCGINLHNGKKELVKARLNKRLRALGLHDFGDYLDLVRRDTSGDELTTMLDALCTNLTGFFREPAHFEFLADQVIPQCGRTGQDGRRTLRVWSAGCSSGEEPYSIAMTILETLNSPGRWDVGVLATDLSTGALLKAKKGVYSPERLDAVPRHIAARYFEIAQRQPDKLFRVRNLLREQILFARLNLMASWPMHGQFDAIFCRNVMIYFDQETERNLIGRFWEKLAPGGVLMIGHSESLAAFRNQFSYVAPTIYRKV